MFEFIGLLWKSCKACKTFMYKAVFVMGAHMVPQHKYNKINYNKRKCWFHWSNCAKTWTTTREKKKEHRQGKQKQLECLHIGRGKVSLTYHSYEVTYREPTWIGVRSTLAEGERGSTRCLMFLMAGSGLTCLDAHNLLSLDPMILKCDFVRIKHTTKLNTQSLETLFRTIYISAYLC